MSSLLLDSSRALSDTPDSSDESISSTAAGWLQGENSICLDGLELVYQRMGAIDDPAVILIMGLGGQLVSWPDSFCQGLLEAGFQVIRFDNRDSGLSSKFDIHGRPRLLRMAGAQAIGRPVQTPYTLDEMAADVIGLMDGLKLEQAHVVGISMGGMIAQILAAAYPERIHSLASMMSTSGAPGLPGPSLKLRLRMLRKRSAEPDKALEDSIHSIRLIGSPAYPRSDEELRATLLPQIRRNVCPDGVKRQLAAILASGSRAELLPRIQRPSLILHGEADPLIPVACAHDLASRIPQARLHTIEGLGHDLPEAAMPTLLQPLLEHLDQTR